MRNLRYYLCILCFSLLIHSNIHGITYKVINGNLEPINPYDQSEDEIYIDNQSIVEALFSYQNELAFLKQRVEKNDLKLAALKNTNVSLKMKFQKFEKFFMRQY